MFDARAVPRDDSDFDNLLITRPPAWEYLLYAGRLHAGRERLEPMFRDHQLRFARSNGQHGGCCTNR